MSFFSILEARVAAVNSLLCVGLDPHQADIDKLRETNASASDSELCLQFCTTIVEATKHVAAAYKPNAAFFEALGPEGVAVMNKVITEVIPDEIPCVLDAKRGDISSTAKAYAVAAFDVSKANCITLNPYMGFDSISPFLEGDKSKGCFAICKTSNPSSSDFETLQLQSGEMLYEYVAKKCAEWNKVHGNNIGVVVGATDIEALQKVRSHAPDMWILAPGVGFQGGNLLESARSGLRADGSGLLVPVSRGISRAEDPRVAAETFRDQLNTVRSAKEKTEESLAAYQEKFFSLALKCGVLKFGSFTLKSGRISPYFFNAGLFSTGSALAQLSECYAEALAQSKIQFDVIFGPAYKGIPLASIIAQTLHQKYAIDVGVAYNRKEAKDHGEGGVLVGASMKGKRVMIVDDVITAGTAIRASMAMLAKEEAQVVGVSVALDREEIASEDSKESAIQKVQSDFNITVCSVAGLTHLLSYLQGHDPETLKTVVAYREKYGIKK